MNESYPWPASKLTAKEMELLYEERKRSSKPICLLIKEAINKVYGKKEES